MTAATPTYSSNIGTVPGFGSALRSEWTKMRSVRSFWIIVTLLVVLSIGFSALMAFVQGITFDDWGPAEQAVFDPVINSTIGILFSIVLLVVLGVTTATSEYSSGTIRTSFIVTPNRTRVFFAKALLLTLIATPLAAISMLGMFLVSQVIFESYGMQSASLGDSDAQQLLLVYGLVAGAMYALISMSIGFILRGTASAITVAIGLFFVIWMFAPLMPSWVQENIITYFPDVALDSLGGVTSSDSLTYLDPVPAGVTVAVWIVASMAIAVVLLNRRDT